MVFEERLNRAKEITMRKWNIYFEGFERFAGGPIGTVEARTQDEAVAKAQTDPLVCSRRPLGMNVTAVPVSESVADFVSDDCWSEEHFVNGRVVPRHSES
jgi:hypothetical protein